MVIRGSDTISAPTLSDAFASSDTATITHAVIQYLKMRYNILLESYDYFVRSVSKNDVNQSLSLNTDISIFLPSRNSDGVPSTRSHSPYARSASTCPLNASEERQLLIFSLSSQAFVRVSIRSSSDTFPPDFIVSKA